MTNKIKVALVDLDGCISDDEWRLHLIRPISNPDLAYREYHYHGGKDSLLKENLASIFRIIKNAPIIIASARPEYTRKHTNDWLINHRIEPILVMLRQEGDRDPAPLVKSKMLDSIWWGIVEVAWAFDDRADVIDMYKRKGVLNAFVLKKDNS